MIGLLWSALYLMLPAYASNMAPVLVRKHFSWLAFPMDFGMKLGGRPVLGANKTYRGLIFGVISGIAVAYLQFLLGDAGGLAVLDYSNWAAIGFLMGSGAILGDAAESFIKRRLGIQPGKPFIPFDQTDFTIGALLFLSFLYQVDLALAVTAVIASAFLHIIANHVAFYLRIRKEKW